jgi:hypothetical protein
VANVETVSTVVAGLVDGVNVAGAKPHDAPDGKPEQLSETDDENPLSGVIETVAVTLFPDKTVRDVGVRVTAKSATGMLMVYSAVATLLLAYPAAIAIASIVSVDDTEIGTVYLVEEAVGVVPLVV